MDYKKAGVDIEAGYRSVELMKADVKATMRPEVLAADEIGQAEDVQAIAYAMHCGCRMIATAHGDSMEDINKKPVLSELIREKRFGRYVILKKRGNVKHIFDREGRALYDAG